MGKLIAVIVAWFGISAVSLACAGIMSLLDVPKPIRRIVQRTALHERAWLSPSEQSLLDSINQYRATRGRGPLRTDPRLQEAARARAPYARYGTGHMVRGRSPMADARRHGYNGACGENLAWGSSTPHGAVFNQWAHSPGHNRNQLGNWNTAGVGVSGRTYVAMFGK